MSEKNNSFQLMLDITQNIFYEYDIRSEEISWSGAVQKVLGYSLDEMQSTVERWAELIHPDERQQALNFLKAAGKNAESPYEFEYRFLHKNGEYLWLRDKGIYQTNEKAVIVRVLGIQEDITAQKTKELKLAEDAKQARTLLNAIPDMIFRISTEGIFLDFKAESQQDLIIPPEAFLGKSIYDVLPSSLAEETMNHVHQAVQTNQTVIYEYQAPRISDNTLRSYEARIVISGPEEVTALIQDITERKKVQDEAQESRRTLTTLLGNLPGMAYRTLNQRDWPMDFVSEGSLALTGYHPEDLIRSKKIAYGDLIHPEDQDEVWNRIQESISKNQQFGVVYRIKTASGDERIVSERGSGVWAPTGELLALEGFIEDVTEQKRLEQQVREAFERRGYQVQVSTEISQEIAAATELEDLFKRVVTLTKENLGYYHAQLLRYDSAQNSVVLLAGYGVIGQKMFEMGHKMPMGSGLIGTAAATGKTMLRPSLADDPDWQPNPLLPETKGEIAVPIKLGNEVLGVLDIQSNQDGALTEDDRLLLEGLCGQIATAIEGTRLRGEMNERLDEITRLNRAMSHEGWQSFRQTEILPQGFAFDQLGVIPLQAESLAAGLFTSTPITVAGETVIGTLAVANDPQNPFTDEENDLLAQVAEQVALALESARLFEQTQAALAQTDKLSGASLRFARATNLQEILEIAIETIDIPNINRATLLSTSILPDGNIDGITVIANWWNQSGHQATPTGTHYSVESLQMLDFMISSEPVFFDNVSDNNQIGPDAQAILRSQNTCSVAVLPLYIGPQQIGVVVMESEEAHNFTQNEISLLKAIGPQIATVFDNRRQFERAQRQAEREAMLNAISQKIQSATSVEAVLQIAARELGHALGAPRAIAQLSMKDK